MRNNDAEQRQRFIQQCVQQQRGGINKKYVFLKNIFLILPIALIECFVIFTEVYFQFLSPQIHNYVEQHERLFFKVFMDFLILTPTIYLLWVSFCVMMMIARFWYIKFPVIELPTILGIYIPAVWLWTWGASAIFQIKPMFRTIIQSAWSLEAWGLLSVFVSLIILMETIFLRGQILIFNYDYGTSRSEQNKAHCLKNMILCFFTLIFTTFIIIYI